MSLLAEQWYTRLWHWLIGASDDSAPRHPVLARMSAFYCNPLLNGHFRELYVSSDSIAAALSQRDRRYEATLSAQVAHTKLYRPEYED